MADYSAPVASVRYASGGDAPQSAFQKFAAGFAAARDKSKAEADKEKDLSNKELMAMFPALVNTQQVRLAKSGESPDLKYGNAGWKWQSPPVDSQSALQQAQTDRIRMENGQIPQNETYKRNKARELAMAEMAKNAETIAVMERDNPGFGDRMFNQLVERYYNSDEAYLPETIPATETQAPGIAGFFWKKVVTPGRTLPPRQYQAQQAPQETSTAQAPTQATAQGDRPSGVLLPYENPMGSGLQKGQLDAQNAKLYYNRAGGNQAIAEKMAREEGWSF